MRGCELLGFWEVDQGNIKEAKALYKKACDLGHEGGCSAFEKLKVNEVSQPRVTTD